MAIAWKIEVSSGIFTPEIQTEEAVVMEMTTGPIDFQNRFCLMTNLAKCFADRRRLANKFCEINRILQNGGVGKRKHSAHKMAKKWQVPADDKGTGKEYTGIVAKWAKGRPLFREI